MTELREKPYFERVYAEFKEKVARYVHGNISNVHDAEDVVSEVFVKVLDGLTNYDKRKASLSTWIYAITRNAVIDYFRAAKQFCELPEELSDAENAEEKLLNEEALENLAAALKQLSERDRDIVVLRYYSGKKLKNIADTMNISYSYAKLLHANALKRLRELIN